MPMPCIWQFTDCSKQGWEASPNLSQRQCTPEGVFFLTNFIISRNPCRLLCCLLCCLLYIVSCAAISHGYQSGPGFSGISVRATCQHIWLLTFNTQQTSVYNICLRPSCHPIASDQGGIRLWRLYCYCTFHVYMRIIYQMVKPAKFHCTMWLES